jgi:hypothetical protein
MAKVYARQLRDVAHELDRAIRKFKRFNSAHEGIAVLREEYLELEREVFKRAKKRKLAKMREEAMQCAAMAIRFMTDVTDK